MSKIKLSYVQTYRDCRGKVRHYVRRRGKPNVPLPGLPGSPEFMAAYQSAIASDGHAPPAVYDTRKGRSATWSSGSIARLPSPIWHHHRKRLTG
jgi:hypothetical protein